MEFNILCDTIQQGSWISAIHLSVLIEEFTKFYSIIYARRNGPNLHCYMCREGKKTNKRNTPVVDRAKRKKNIPEMNNAQSVVNPVAVFTQRKQRS